MQILSRRSITDRPTNTLCAAALLAMFLITGCGSVSLPPPAPPPVEESSENPPVPTLPSESTKNSDPTDSAKPNAASNSAALLLLAQSENLRTEGKGQQAIAMVERAIRLEPSNGDLWIQLGRLNYEANALERAEQYARRGIALTKEGSESLKIGWLLLADVSAARGDIEGARQIRLRWLNARG